MLDAKPKQEIEKLVTGCIVGQIVIIVRGQFTEELANLGVKMAARSALDHLLFGLEKTSGAVQNMEVLSYRLVVFPVWVGCLWSNLAVLNGSKRTTPLLFVGERRRFLVSGWMWRGNAHGIATRCRLAPVVVGEWVEQPSNAIHGFSVSAAG